VVDSDGSGTQAYITWVVVRAVAAKPVRIFKAAESVVGAAPGQWRPGCTHCRRNFRRKTLQAASKAEKALHVSAGGNAE